MGIQCLDAVVHQQIRIYQVGIRSYFLTFRPSHSFPQVNIQQAFGIQVDQRQKLVITSGKWFHLHP